MSQSVLVLLIIAIALVLFVTELIPLPATAMFVCVACYFTGAISAKEANCPAEVLLVNDMTAACTGVRSAFLAAIPMVKDTTR